MSVPIQNWVYYPKFATAFHILFSTLFWTFLYKLITCLPLPRYQKPIYISNRIVRKRLGKFEIKDTQNRIVSLIHGMMCIVLAIYDITYVALPCGSPNTKIQNFTITMNIGYFIYDAFVMDYLGLLNWAISIHHFIWVIGIYLSLCFDASASEILAGLFVGEISNPVMHLRLILRNFGYKDTKIYHFIEYCFILIYIYYRLFKGFIVVSEIVKWEGNHPVIKGIAVGLAIHSYFFIYKMIILLRNRFI